VLVACGLEQQGQLVVGEPVDGWPKGSDPAAVAGDVADEPVLPDGGGQG
jgi:hypothetical protein